MEAVMSAGSILAGAVVFFAIVFWFGDSFSRLFRPASRLLEAGDMHAQVYASEVKTSAIQKASKLNVDKKAFDRAKSNLDAVSAFNFDIVEEKSK